jgi:uncharacterized protein with von Willebrand factor type A (vWA) domain
MSHLLENLLVFGRLLRALGLEVHVGRLLDLAQALQHVDLGARDEVYHTCRTLLVRRHEHLPLFDRAFEAFWARRAPQPAGPEPAPATAPKPPHDAPFNWDGSGSPAGHVEAPTAGLPEGDQPALLRTWSDAAVLAHKDLGAFTDEERALASAALERLVWSPGERRTRRWVAGRGPRIDLRRALAHSIRTRGDLLELPRRRQRRRMRPIVLVCDVSGSMERYSRMLVHFAHALGRRYGRVETFVFSTELTRVTPALRVRCVNDALGGIVDVVRHWSGGTRIGAALKTLNRVWRRRVLHGAPVVLVISDGWDCGDPDVLRDQIARLRRSCHRLIWLNPLLGTRDYQPLTRGLQAALPLIDDFLPARTLRDLVDLAAHLNRLARL